MSYASRASTIRPNERCGRKFSIMKCSSKGGSLAKGTKSCVGGCNRTGTDSLIVNQFPKDKLCIVHFPHSSVEYPIQISSRSNATALQIGNNSYDVFWNCSKDHKHYRRLVRINSGVYIDRDGKYNEIKDEQLCVWTEWESITHADNLRPSSNPLGAEFIHQPKYPVSVAVAAKNPHKFYGNGNPVVRQAKLGRTNRMKGICTAKKTTCR